MSNEECEKVLKELDEVRPEKLNDKAKRLFEAMMKIADERDSVKADLYEANNRINDLLDIAKQKDKEIEELKEECKEVVCIPEGTCFMLKPKDVDKKWEDKIKAKIEEIENTGIDVAWEQINYTIREQDRAKIEVLQSLLEKE